MHQETLKEIVSELATLLTGRFLGKVFQLSDFSIVIDFGLKSEGYLFISVEPGEPRLYLVNRTVRELQKASTSVSAFAHAIRTNIGGGRLLSVTKDEDERIVRFFITVTDELGKDHDRILVAQLTGRSANLYLLNSEGIITQALRTPKGEGQQIGNAYRPATLQVKRVSQQQRLVRGAFPTLSAAADELYRRSEIEHEFEGLAANLRGKLKREISRRKTLKANLKKDLAAHGNPEEHKRLGDLLLANIPNAERVGSKVTVKDYYAEGSPSIDVQIDENKSLQEAASESFSRYTKAKRAVEEIANRFKELDRELSELAEKEVALEKAVTTRDAAALAVFHDPTGQAKSGRKKQKASVAFTGMRRYRSSDGYEVLVGRTARDNDNLTFRVARPNDLWLHAGDYPGSHVVVRNISRKEIPQRTVIEAAQLAAKFSQAGKDSKVTIHYTPRKFLSKPKGAAPGLARMSSFKTITVEPAETIERI